MKAAKAFVALLLGSMALAASCSEGDEPATGSDEQNIEHPFVIRLKPGAGLGAAPFELTVEPSDTVLDLKRMISLHENGKVPIEQQQLLVEEAPLADNGLRLDSCGLEHHSEVTINKVEAQASVEGTKVADKPNDMYFGVDANDPEAVKAKLRELGDDKFRELFGEHVNPEHIGLHEPAILDVTSDAHTKIKDAFKWLYNIVSSKRNEEPENKK